MAVEEAKFIPSVKPIVADGFDLAALEVGRVVEARVMSIASGLALLASRQGTMQADLSALGAGAAAIGDVLRLKVTAIANGDGSPKLTLALAEPAASTATPAATPAAAAASSPAEVLARAARAAAVGQNGLAPLYASLAGLAEAPEGAVPAAVRTLAQSLMQGRLGADGVPTGADVARAFAASGLFRESRGAGGEARDLKSGLAALKGVLTAWLGAAASAARAPTGVPTAGDAPRGATASPAATGAAAAATPSGTEAAADRPAGLSAGQTTAASLSARVASARYAGLPLGGVPPPGAGGSVLGPIGWTPAGPGPSSVAAGIAGAGVGATPVAPGAEGAASPVGGGPIGGAAPPSTGAGAVSGAGEGDAVGGGAVTGAAPQVVAGGVRAGAGVSQPGPEALGTASVATVGATVAAPVGRPGIDGAGIAAGASAAAPLAAGAIADRVMRPPPPRRGQPTRGQAALAPEIADDPEAATALGRRTLERADGALKRILLEQFAVLDRSVDEAAAVGTRPVGWTAELPLATASGTGVVQMTVERDATGGGKGETEKSAAWRVRFSLDVEPIGPVHVRIGLSGERMSIGLWVERPEMAARLAGEIGTLGGALEAAAIPVEGLHVQVGEPAAAKPSGSAHFIDVSL